MLMIKETRSQERNGVENRTGRESIDRAAKSLLETSTRTAIDGTQAAKCNSMLFFGKT